MPVLYKHEIPAAAAATATSMARKSINCMKTSILATKGFLPGGEERERQLKAQGEAKEKGSSFSGEQEALRSPATSTCHQCLAAKVFMCCKWRLTAG